MQRVKKGSQINPMSPYVSNRGHKIEDFWSVLALRGEWIDLIC